MSGALLGLIPPGYQARSLNGSATSGEYPVKKQRNSAASRLNVRFGVCLQGPEASSDIAKLEVNGTKRHARTDVFKSFRYVMKESSEQKDEPQDIQVEKTASERLLIFYLAQAISHDDMRSRYVVINDRPKVLTNRPR